MKKVPLVILSLLSMFLLSGAPCNAEKSVKNAQCALVLRDDGGKQLYEVPMHDGAAFAVRFIHSVAGTPVTDYFLVKNCSLYLDKTIYHDFGAGLPHFPEDGQQMKTANGEISITGFNRHLEDLSVRVGRVAHHTLILFEDGDEEKGISHELPLEEFARPGSAVLFMVRNGH